MPQFDYQQLCHFVLPEQGGLSVETILKRFLHLTPREIRHANIFGRNSEKRCFLPHKCSRPDWRIRSLFDMSRSVPTFLKIRFCRYQVILPAYGFSMRTVISVSQTSHPVWSATLPTAIIPIPDTCCRIPVKNTDSAF